jgi:hypothetical protein
LGDGSGLGLRFERRGVTQDLAGQTSSTAMGLERGALTDTAALAVTQAKQINKPWYQIDPRKSKVMGYWDSVTGLALIFTALVTPFEVAFLEAAESATEPMFIVNRCMRPSTTPPPAALVHWCTRACTRALVHSCARALDTRPHGYQIAP